MNYFLIASAAVMAGTAVAAQTPSAPPAPPVPIVRPMADKVMTRAETVAMVREHFGRLDTDRNGAVTTAEAAQVRQRMGDHWRARRAEHGDDGAAHVMRFEQRDPKAAFDRLDVNKDGTISFDEYSKAHEQRIERRVEIREKRKDARKDDKREFRMHRMGRMGGDRLIVLADSNHDGQITLGEAEAMALQHFDRMDSNHDGQVTSEERRSGREVIIQEFREKRGS